MDIERFSSVFYLEKTSANLIADIQFLPLQHRSISETRRFHVLEHVENLKLAFQELKRVSEKLIINACIWKLNLRAFQKSELLKLRSE